MAKIMKKSKHSWVAEFEKKGIKITGILKELSAKEWAKNCVPMFKDSKEILSKTDIKFNDVGLFSNLDTPDGLYVVVKGLIAVGDIELHPINSEDVYYFEHLCLRPYSLLGEFEVEIKNFDGHSFESIPLQQRAWYSSPVLSELVAYKVTHKSSGSESIFKNSEYIKHIKNQEWVLLKIPLDLVDKFISDERLKYYLLFDSYKKSRHYFLIPKEKGKRFKKEEQQDEQTRHAQYIAKMLKAFCLQRTAQGYCYDNNETTKIFGSERMHVISGTKIKMSMDEDRARAKKPGYQIWQKVCEYANNMGFSITTQREKPTLLCGQSLSPQIVITMSITKTKT